VVEPQDAFFSLEKDFPLPPALLWEYLTKPEYRAVLLGSDNQSVEDLKRGRIADGSVYICAHGKNAIRQSIVDWHPFEQYTINNAVPGGGFALTTIRLTPKENSTTATVLFGETQGGVSIMRGLLKFVGRKMVGPTIRDGLQALSEIVEDEITNGKISQQPAIEVPASQIENALSESLTQT
jgi:uncharacterized protein YndB with AHSA1/START domain